MSNIINTNLIAYLSLVLVLSYFILHNIILVFSGIIGSLILINKSYINIHSHFYKSNEFHKVDSEISEVKYQKIENAVEYSKLNLVEKIEELGYIPSKTNNDDDKAA